MSSSLASFISSSQKLIGINLPAFFLTEEVVGAVAKLPLIESLDYWFGTEETYEESGICFEFTPGSFPQLEILAFAALPTRMAKVLQATDHVGKLQKIHLDCPAYYSLQEIETVFANVAAGARCLSDVTMVCCPVRQLRSSSSKDSLSIDTIRPLLSCSQLTRFYLSAPHFTPLKDEDVIKMRESWPEMGALSLCPSPLVKRDVGAHFDILSTFSKNLPNLWELKLFFGHEISEFNGDLHPAHQFTELETLGVGLSPVPRHKAQNIGFLLASLCQNPPSIESGRATYDRGDGITEEEMGDLTAACSEVRSMMSLAFRIKKSAIRKFQAGGSPPARE